MTERGEIDDALDTAIERALEAEERFLDTPRGTAGSVERAFDVEQRAEEVEQLSGEARREIGEGGR